MNNCGRYRVLVLTLGNCGLRWDEVAVLRLHSVDLRRGRIEVSQAVAEINGRIVLGTPKSHQTRWLPVPRLLIEGLEEQAAGKSADDLVFPSPQGGYLRVGNFRRATSTEPPSRSVSPASIRTSCDTRRRPWRSRRARPSRVCSGCSATGERP